jgi:hypothetical protein
MMTKQDQKSLNNKFSVDFLIFLKKTLELLTGISDTINSIPAKPLLQSTLKCGGFLLLWGQGL